jgi:hypothetical protein
VTTRRPCTECPWVAATPRGQFPPTRYTELRNTTGAPGNEAPPDAPWFACHKAPPGEEFHCAGWLAAVGYYHLGVRLSCALGRTDPAALDASPGWPELHPDYRSLEQVHGDRRVRPLPPDGYYARRK